MTDSEEARLASAPLAEAEKKRPEPTHKKPAAESAEIQAPATAPTEPQERAAVRQAWLNERHPGWTSSRWCQHVHIAYKTMRKYWDGITTNQTPSVRADIAKAEKVDFSTVPE